MTLTLNASTAATAAIPLSPSTAPGESKGGNSAISRRSEEGSRPPAPPHNAGSTTADPAYTLSGAASTSNASAKASDVTGVQPDIDGDGARLLALQVQQDLSSQSTPIVNASSTSILGLFKS